MTAFVALVEEQSAEELLKVLLPKLLPAGMTHRILVFRGKQDLEKRLKQRLRAWMEPDSVFLVLRDQDSADCGRVKGRLRDLVDASGRAVRTVVRVACHELESYYLGDLRAVEAGLGVEGLGALQQKSKYREPDRLGSPSRELEKLTRGAYRKIAGSRRIAPHLALKGNRSRSFNVLVAGIRRLVCVHRGGE